MIYDWGWPEFLVALAVLSLLMDTHKRASKAMDAAHRIEDRLRRLEDEYGRNSYRSDDFYNPR